MAEPADIHAFLRAIYGDGDPRTAYRDPATDIGTSRDVMPTLQSLPDNRPSLRPYDPQANRPRDAMAPVAENLSPTMGGYGAGQLLAEIYGKGREGDWSGVADRTPWLAGAALPIPGMKRGMNLEVRPMSTRALHQIGEANFTTPYRIDPVAHVPLESLQGAHYRPERVAPLADTIRANNWIEPLVVDREGNVIEGQHRLRALGSLGETTAPVHRLRELASRDQVGALQDAATAMGIHPEQGMQIARQILEIVDKEGAGALKEYAAPRGFEKSWNAAVAAMLAQK